MQLADLYTYRVTFSEEDQEHVGLCAEFPSLSWLDKTREGALNGIVNLVLEVLQDMEQSGEQPPVPLTKREYSGEIRVRIPPVVHARLALTAAEEKTSLNRIIVQKLSA